MIPGLRRCSAVQRPVESRCRCAVGARSGHGERRFFYCPPHPTPSRLDGCGWCGHADACTHVCTGGETHTHTGHKTTHAHSCTSSARRDTIMSFFCGMCMCMCHLHVHVHVHAARCRWRTRRMNHTGILRRGVWSCYCYVLRLEPLPTGAEPPLEHIWSMERLGGEPLSSLAQLWAIKFFCRQNSFVRASDRGVPSFPQGCRPARHYLCIKPVASRLYLHICSRGLPESLAASLVRLRAVRASNHGGGARVAAVEE